MAKEKTPQEYLIKAKLYRFVSYIFVALGLFVFAVMYVKNVEGRLMEALRDPMIILLFLVPFFPAVILTMLADGADKKYKKALEAAQPKK